MNYDKLPEVCYATHPHQGGEVVLLKRGETGYWPVCVFPDNDHAKAFVEERNAAMEITKAQSAAMVNGSIFGFHCKGADPEFLVKDGMVEGPITLDEEVGVCESTAACLEDDAATLRLAWGVPPEIIDNMEKAATLIRELGGVR